MVPDHPHPPKRIRLAPWLGPVHFLLLLCTSALTLLLPLLYVAFLAGSAWWLGSYAFDWISDLALSARITVHDAGPFALIACGTITWLFMLRPLLPQKKSVSVALQVTPASQPGLFAVVDELCWHLHIPPPDEIWLDTSIGIRSCLRGGMAGIATGETVLHVGLPVVSVVGAREFAALLLRELAFSAGGIGATFTHVVRELNTWFYRALHERDPWELQLRQEPKEETRWRKFVRITAWLWMSVAKIPFALIVMLSRVICLAALIRLGLRADKCAMRLIGRPAWQQLCRKTAILDEAWQAARTEINRGITQHRLPENLALLLARHVARRARQDSTAPAPRQQDTTNAPPGAGVLPQVLADSPAASLMRGFVDLSRQVTYFYYQHELGITLHEHRMVAEEEVIHQNRREDESLVVIRRYFGGLAHPERAICGLGGTHAESPGRLQLQDEILRVREEMKEWGSRLKIALQEWNIAWQRRRDLEAAATLSMAGFTVSRIQFGTEDTSPAALRSEAARQRMVMEHLESTLQTYEARLESRFAGALGLLWWMEAEELDDRLRDLKRDLPAWVSLYEAMAGALPSFRELLTTFFAFQTLGARYASLDDTGSFFTALQSVVPKMTNLVRQILATMDGAIYPFAADRQPVSLNDHLLQGRLPEPISVSMNPGAALDMKVLSSKMAADASEVIAPFVDRFLALYHRAFAWLAGTAEQTEVHFLGALNLGTDIELLMPEEFARMRQTGLLPSQAPPPCPTSEASPTFNGAL